MATKYKVIAAVAFLPTNEMLKAGDIVPDTVHEDDIARMGREGFIAPVDGPAEKKAEAETDNEDKGDKPVNKNVRR